MIDILFGHGRILLVHLKGLIAVGITLISEAGTTCEIQCRCLSATDTDEQEYLELPPAGETILATRYEAYFRLGEAGLEK